jgi:lipoic acid synthetase
VTRELGRKRLQNGVVLSILRLAKDAPSATVLATIPSEIDSYRYAISPRFSLSVPMHLPVIPPQDTPVADNRGNRKSLPVVHLEENEQATTACGSNAAIFPPSRRLPPWLRREVPKGNANHFTWDTLRELKLETVCENAKCPNRMECYSQKTATFMIMGNVCTRPCGFCAVSRGRPDALELDEPERVAEAASRLGLKHVVITSVTRDDLPDGGGEHFYQCVLAVRRKTGATIEVLTPDFVQHRQGLDRVIESAPEVFNHNMETVPRMYRRVRGPKSDYRWTLELLRYVKQTNPAIRTKSGLMLGLGETRDELLQCLADLRSYNCDFLTLGQYLQPGPKYLPVVRYVPPEEFDELGELARSMGFVKVASGPFVRSSYHARDMAEAMI